MRRRLPWLPISLWVATAAAGATAIAEALQGRSTAVATVVAIESWTVWGVAWLCLLVPRTASLTVARVLIPTAPLAAVAAAAAGASAVPAVAFVVTALASTLALIHGSTTDAFVDGSSYGDERRFALRVPPLLALTAVPLTWFVATAGLLFPPLVAARAWVGAVVAGLVAAGLARFAWRSLHLLSKRWIVFVPAGVVLHDPLHLADAILLQRRTITALGPAMVGTDATDLSGGAIGLSLQVDVEQPIEIGRVQGRERPPEEVETGRIVFTPLRPGALLAEASGRRVAIGETATTAAVLPACAHGGDHDDHHHDLDDAAVVDEASQTTVPLPSTRSSR